MFSLSSIQTQILGCELHRFPGETRIQFTGLNYSFGLCVCSYPREVQALGSEPAAQFSGTAQTEREPHLSGVG